MTDFLKIAQEFGLWAALCIALLVVIIRDKLGTARRLAKLEDEFRDSLLATVSRNTEALEENTKILGRVEKRLSA